MRKILIFILLIIANSAIAKENKVEQYNALIDKAEMQFSQGNYAAADDSYRHAFNLFSHPLAIDLSNAMVNATMGENKGAFYKYANLFSQYGVQTSYFSKRKSFQYWSGTNEWNMLLKQTDENYKSFVSKNSSLINYVDSLLAFAEQKKEEAFEPTVNVREFREATSLVLDCLFSLFEKQGYISEDLIGVNVINDTTISTSKILKLIEFTTFLPVGNDRVEIVIIKNYDDVLTKAYNECKIGWRDYWANTLKNDVNEKPPVKPSY